eukprot:scaffold798_cov162-Amphora_coffeaeformis.AAC.3
MKNKKHDKTSGRHADVMMDDDLQSKPEEASVVFRSESHHHCCFDSLNLYCCPIPKVSVCLDLAKKDFPRRTMTDVDSNEDKVPSAEVSKDTNLAPFNPSSETAQLQSIALMDLKADDILFDLGCGDGRLLIKAVSQVEGLRCIGVEIDQIFVDRANQAITDLPEHVQKRIQIRCQDVTKVLDTSGSFEGTTEASTERTVPERRRLEDVSIHDVSVIYLYLLPRGLLQIKPLLDEMVSQRLKKGGSLRVVAYTFQVKGWEPSRVDTSTKSGMYFPALPFIKKFVYYGESSCVLTNSLEDSSQGVGSSWSNDDAVVVPDAFKNVAHVESYNVLEQEDGNSPNKNKKRASSTTTNPTTMILTAKSKRSVLRVRARQQRPRRNNDGRGNDEELDDSVYDDDDVDGEEEKVYDSTDEFDDPAYNAYEDEMTDASAEEDVVFDDALDLSFALATIPNYGSTEFPRLMHYSCNPDVRRHFHESRVGGSCVWSLEGCQLDSKRGRIRRVHSRLCRTSRLSKIKARGICKL